MVLMFRRRLAIPLSAIAFFTVAVAAPPPATLLLPPTTLLVIALAGIACWSSQCHACQARRSVTLRSPA